MFYFIITTIFLCICMFIIGWIVRGVGLEILQRMGVLLVKKFPSSRM